MYKSEAYVDLTDMSYGKDNESHTSWTYTARTMPTTFSKKMSATVSQQKEVDIVSKNTRIDGWEMGFNKSTLTWKRGSETWKKDSWKHHLPKVC